MAVKSEFRVVDIMVDRARKSIAGAQPQDTRIITVQSLSALIAELDALRADNPGQAEAVAWKAEKKELQVQQQQLNREWENKLDDEREIRYQQADQHKAEVDCLQGQIDSLVEQLRAARLVQPHAFVQKNARATSTKAAQAVLGRSGSQRVRVLRCIVDARDAGATDDEVAKALDLMPPRVATRRSELTAGNYVEASFLTPTRKTRTGQDAVVWIATQKAIDALKALDLQEMKGN